MDGKLSVDLLKVHNANIKRENTQEKGTIAPSVSNMSGTTATKLNMKDRVFGGGTGSSSKDRSDKHSESSSKISSIHTGTRFSRIKTKLRLHTLFSNALSKRSGSEKGAPTRVLENTYKVEPDDGTKFNQQKGEQIINNVFSMYLKDRVYDEKKFPQLCKTLSDLIKERVKLSGLKRYKVLAYVMVFENKKQSIHYTSRCLWETNLDNFASATYNGTDFVAIGTVFATYYE